MTRLTKTQLRGRKIYNEWHLAALQDEPKVYLLYSPATDGHIARYAQWSFRQNGRGGEIKGSTLHSPSKDKENYRVALLKWATNEYGITEWERSPFGSYHPVGTLARAKGLTIEELT